MRVMGLDLKPARSGIAMNYDAVTGEPRWSATAVEMKSWNVHAQIRAVERAVLYRVSIHRPDKVFIEGTFSRPGGSDYGQHAVHFAATHILWARGVPWDDVAPGTLKVWATGRGDLRGPNKVTKDKVIAAVIATYGHLMSIPAVDDECDAVALATMALADAGLPVVVLDKMHTRAITALRRARLKKKG